MNFNFPDNKIVSEGTIQNRLNIWPNYEPIDILNPLDNLIEIDGTSYYFTYLNGADPGNKGGHSIILNLYASQSIEIEELEYGIPDLILKVSKYKKSQNPEFINQKEKRFLKEIEALKACNNQNFQNVIKIFHSGVCKVKNQKNTRYDEHLFYTMEYAECDLKSYIEANHHNLSINEKVNLCISLCEGLKELFSLGYYHRDIKPDNIFMIDDYWKIGDLGLIGDRNNVNEIDKISERVGPIGWLSPEAMNKYLCEENDFVYDHSCIIDHQSDIFQLGKVFWYIFQHNAPIGSIRENDFLCKDSRLYSIFRTMLNHSKYRRYKDIEEVIKLLKIIQLDLLRRAA
ncbi:MAG: serine/threonine protein kinase [Bacteroidota bacterium]|jgi:serine/threonine protein kinase|nr:serine/threonine protein kinase [Bacteroidota bacterium]